MPTYRQKQKAQKQRRKGKKRKDGKPPTSEESPGNSWGNDQWQSKALNGKDEPPERKEPESTEREERRDRKTPHDTLGSSLRMEVEALDREEKENAKRIEDEKENDDPMIRVMVPSMIIMSILVIAFGIYLKITEKEQNQKNQQTEQKITKDGGANSERNGRKSFSYPGIK